MGFSRLTRGILVVVAAWALGLAHAPATHASRAETGFSFGPAFYSGSRATSLAPTIGIHGGFSVSQLFGRVFNLSHRFDLGLLILGENLAGQGISYQGMSGTYTAGARFNLSKGGVIPYIELGPMLSILALYTSGGSADASNSQTALKYGYNVGVGFDKVKGMRGSGGWGLSIEYFSLLTSPSMFEFNAGSLTAQGVVLKFRILFENEGSK